MIIFGYCIGIFVPCLMYLINNNLAVLVPEFHFCASSPSMFAPVIFGLVIAYNIPFTLMTIIYGMILRQARQSTR